MSLLTQPDQNLAAPANADAVFLVELTEGDTTSVVAATYAASVYATGERKITRTLGDGVEIVDSTHFRVTIPAAQMAPLGGLNLFHEFKAWDGLGKAGRAMSGTLLAKVSHA